LAQIRSEEIRRSISDLLGDQMLHFSSQGSQIQGAFDPDFAFRPMIDAVRFLVCLENFVRPAINFRMRSLINLLPIVDPGLAAAAEGADFSGNGERWFFYVDYTWVDQHLIQTDSNSTYGVQISAIDSDLRRSITWHLRNIGLTGLGIVLSVAAAQRLRVESPTLAADLQEAEVPHGQIRRKFFVLEIPRVIAKLEGLYSLNELCDRIKAFAPSEEGARALELLRQRASAFRTFEEAHSTVQNLGNYPWRGYEEKDEVLKIAIQAWMRCDGLATSSGERELWTAVKGKISEAVVRIGYPTQMIHFAQVQKNLLRDIDVLVSEIISPRSPRFHDAWLYLASIDGSRYSDADRGKILAAVKKVLANEKLRHLPGIPARLIEVATIIGIYHGADRARIVDELFTGIGINFVEDGAKPEVVRILLDRLQFLRIEIGDGLHLDSQMMRALGEYIFQLRPRGRGKMDEWNALVGGWQAVCEAFGLQFERSRAA
jgi:hypothetical protein